MFYCRPGTELPGAHTQLPCLVDFHFTVLSGARRTADVPSSTCLDLLAAELTAHLAADRGAAAKLSGPALFGLALHQVRIITLPPPLPPPPPPPLPPPHQYRRLPPWRSPAFCKTWCAINFASPHPCLGIRSPQYVQTAATQNTNFTLLVLANRNIGTTCYVLSSVILFNQNKRQSWNFTGIHLLAAKIRIVGNYADAGQTCSAYCADSSPVTIGMVPRCTLLAGSGCYNFVVACSSSPL